MPRQSAVAQGYGATSGAATTPLEVLVCDANQREAFACGKREVLACASKDMIILYIPFCEQRE